MARLRDIFGGNEDIATPINAVSTATGASQTADIDVQGYAKLTVAGIISAAGAGTDVAISAKAFAADGSTVINQDMPTIASVAAALVGSEAITQRQYDVRGVAKVRLTITNNNAATKNATIHSHLGR